MNKVETERLWARECSRRAAALGVGFQFDDRASTAYTDGNTVYCPTLPDNATPEDFTVLRGQVIHECGHVVRKEVFEILRRFDVKGGSPIWGIMNMIEDEAQERAIARQFPGDETAMRDLWAILMQRQIDQASKDSPIPDPESADKARRMMAAGVCARVAAGDWQGKAVSMIPEFLEQADRIAPGTSATFQELEREGWVSKIRACGPVSDSWDAAQALHKRLFPEEPEPKDGGKAAGQPDKGDMGEMSGEPSETSHDNPQDGLTKEQKAQAAEIPWHLILNSDHGQEKLNGVPAPSRIDWTGKPRNGRVRFYDSERVRVPASGSAPSAVTNPDPFLIQDVRRRLQVLARRKWQIEQTEGRLDPRNAPRIVMPQVGDGTYNRQIFRNQTPRQQLDTAVTVMIDCSGSMSGRKHMCAAQAGVALYDLFTRALRVPTEVLGFTTYSGPTYWEFKKFSERRMDRATLAGRICSHQVTGAMSGNADGDALMFAWDRIKNRKEKRKVIIVLSDGSPSDAAGGDSDATLIAAIRSIRGNRGGEVYGIGVMDTNVRRYYSRTAPVINKPEDVTGALIHTLQDVLQRKPGGGH